MIGPSTVINVGKADLAVKVFSASIGLEKKVWIEIYIYIFFLNLNRGIFFLPNPSV